MTDERGKTGIGTKETISLKPATVKIVGYRIEMQRKDGKDIGEKVAISCKHPDREENIEISSIAYKKGKEIKNSGLWWKLDADKLIPKQSALAQLLAVLKASNLDEIIGREAQTELDEKGYLCFKAY